VCVAIVVCTKTLLSYLAPHRYNDVTSSPSTIKLHVQEQGILTEREGSGQLTSLYLLV
jgi:hypothetical protein